MDKKIGGFFERKGKKKSTKKTPLPKNEEELKQNLCLAWWSSFLGVTDADGDLLSGACTRAGADAGREDEAATERDEVGTATGTGEICCIARSMACHSASETNSSIRLRKNNNSNNNNNKRKNTSQARQNEGRREFVYLLRKKKKKNCKILYLKYTYAAQPRL